MNTLKFFIPPIIKIIIKYFFYSSSKTFKNYELIKKHLGQDYNNSEITNVVFKKTNIKLEKLYQKNYIYDSNDLLLLSLFFLIKKTCNVLDVGGGSGIHYHVVKSFNEHLILNWDVLETPEMVKNNMNNTINELNFIADIKKINKTYDLLFLSGVIQYLDDPYIFLNELFKIKAKKILITRTPFLFENGEFYSVQKSLLSENGPGKLPEDFSDKFVKYPHYSFNYFTFIKYLSTKKYKSFKILNESSWEFNNKKYKMMSILITV